MTPADGQNDLAYRPSDRPKESWEWLLSVLRWLYSFIDEPEEIVVMGMVIFGTGLAVIGFRKNGIAYFGEFNVNLVTEIISILFTIFILNRLQARRLKQSEKDALVLQMGSPDNTFAIEAVRQLRNKGWLEGVTLQKANLNYTNLSNANLYGANLNNASLIKARLHSANLSNANLSNASLHEAKLGRAYLIKADLSNADLRDADLRGAYLTGADLTGAKLSNTKYDHQTVWPHGFDPDAAGAKMVDD
mgnify:CR=1 FL=1